MYLASGEEKKQLICNSCFGGIPVYKTISYSPNFALAAVSSYENEAIRELLHAFKYKRFQGAREPIERLIEKHLREVNLRKLVPHDTVIIPIPLHKKRLRQRGFNQAEEIAEILSSHLGLSVESRVLVRIEDTPHQTTLKSRVDRKESVRNSFGVLSYEKVKNKSVLLVDDVYTSGATMGEAIKTLRKAGVKNFLCFVVAKTT